MAKPSSPKQPETERFYRPLVSRVTEGRTMKKKQIPALTIITIKCETCEKVLEDQSGYTEYCDECFKKSVLWRSRN
jgi:hypothetical protein